MQNARSVRQARRASIGSWDIASTKRQRRNGFKINPRLPQTSEHDMPSTQRLSPRRCYEEVQANVKRQIRAFNTVATTTASLLQRVFVCGCVRGRSAGCVGFVVGRRTLAFFLAGCPPRHPGGDAATQHAHVPGCICNNNNQRTADTWKWRYHGWSCMGGVDREWVFYGNL